MPLPVVQSHLRIDELERHRLELFEEDVVAFVVLLLKMTYEDDVVRMSTISQPQHSSSFNVCLVCVIIIFCRTQEIIIIPHLMTILRLPLGKVSRQ